MTKYTLVRSKRKTVAIYITRDAAVEVRAPLRAPRAGIDRFVASKQAWIDSHLAAREASLKSRAAFLLNYGDAVPMGGKTFPITARAGGRAGFDGECLYIPPDLPPGEIKRAVIEAYRALAKTVLPEKAAMFSTRMGAAPAAVKINGARTRWGSCSGKNSVNFSWRLMMADGDAIGYVVVHELAHIREHNHSARFWAAVAGVLPDYRERQKKLKELQKRLASEDWDEWKTNIR